MCIRDSSIRLIKPGLWEVGVHIADVTHYVKEGSVIDKEAEKLSLIHISVTVKTRLGWDNEHKIIVDLAEQLQDCGIEALTIHGRTLSLIHISYTYLLLDCKDRHFRRNPSYLTLIYYISSLQTILFRLKNE